MIRPFLPISRAPASGGRCSDGFELLSASMEPEMGQNSSKKMRNVLIVVVCGTLSRVATIHFRNGVAESFHDAGTNKWNFLSRHSLT